MQPRHVVRSGEGVAGVARRPESRAAENRESIEQFEAYLQRQLLARERVDNGFEHRRKPGRLHASECVGERPQPRITRGHVVPVGQIDSKPEQPINDRSHPSSLHQRPRPWRRRHDQSRRLTRARLPHGEFGWPSSEHDHTSIGGAIPAVDQVPRTAPQRPHREIEAERRNWSQHERQRGVALADGGAHRADRRGRLTPACLDFVDRRDFFRRYSSKATALLCCVSCEL